MIFVKIFYFFVFSTNGKYIQITGCPNNFMVFFPKKKKKFLEQKQILQRIQIMVKHGFISRMETIYHKLLT